MMTCPKCNAAAEDDATECPACGIFFTKWKEREDAIASGDTTRYAALATATSSEFNRAILVIFCAVIVGIFYFLQLKANP